MNITREEIVTLLGVRGKEQEDLFKKAAEVRHASIGNKVYFRGLIEISNICKNDCYYCGIRRSNKNVERYTMSIDDVMECVDFSHSAGYGSVVFQSGERTDKEFICFLKEIVSKTKSKYPSLGITLSVGELDKATYEELYKAGANRALIRIETSNEEHYKQLHPAEMSFKHRVNCLKTLKEIGYQVGTGVMIGSPHQKLEYLADDILFFMKLDVDMVGMGPFLAHKDTIFAGFDSSKNLDLALNMVAILRIAMPTINIAAATALQAIKPDGRELGLIAGANVIMPLITPRKYRGSFKLYDNKPCIDESAEQCMTCIVNRVKSTGLIPAFNESGDSKHFKAKRG